MQSLVDRIERALRIDAAASAESLMRIRAAWAIGATFAATQFSNLFVLWANYHRWTYDHTITVICITIVVGLVALIRWRKNPALHAAAYSALMLAGILGSALPDRTGVNSALVPFIALGPVMCGFMAGRTGAIAFFIAGAAMLVFLYYESLSHAPLMASGDFSRETNRFAQGFFALSLSTVISVLVSARSYLFLSELSDAADRARKAEAAKSAFLATISHELRTPLNGVIGLADTLARAGIPDTEQSLARTIGRSGEGMLRILNDLLDLSKIEAGKFAIDPHPVSPLELVRQVVDTWRETAHAKGLSISGGGDGEIPETVLADGLRVSQILQNFVSNAAKFTDAGEITVTVSATLQNDGRYLLAFRVKDTGRGVPDHLLERIFERFEQGGAGIARRYGGTGLGLPICRDLAALMGGSVGVERTGPDGTTFLLALTVGVPRPLQRDPSFSADETSNLRVLVADDNEVNRLVLHEYLRGLGVGADFVADGAAGVALAASARYDLILLDKEMPVFTGLEAARAIRDGGGPSMGAVIVLVTGDAGDADHCDRILSAGIDERIVKPVSRDAIEALLRRLVETAEAA
jgi:signal transduction histidine kinase/CheY-like chemotaxis protein